MTGGYVYRGNTIPSLYGKYIYGDWCTGDIWSLEYINDGNHINEHLLRSDINITSFGVDQNDELFFCGNENIYKLKSNLGDINEDGIINILDVVIIINIILNTEYNELADLNDDDIINVLDIVQLVNIVLE